MLMQPICSWNEFPLKWPKILSSSPFRTNCRLTENQYFFTWHCYLIVDDTWFVTLDWRQHSFTRPVLKHVPRSRTYVQVPGWSNHGFACRFSQLSATDVSARTTMKGAAKCDKQCDLQNSVNQQGFERILRWLSDPVNNSDCSSVQFLNVAAESLVNLIT